MIFVLGEGAIYCLCASVLPGSETDRSRGRRRLIELIVSIVGGATLDWRGRLEGRLHRPPEPTEEEEGAQ